VNFKELPASRVSLGKRSLIHGVGVNDADYIVVQKNNGKQVTCHIFSQISFDNIFHPGS